MFTLIIWEHEKSAPLSRNNQPLKHCRNMATLGGFYKVQIVDQSDATIEEYKV